MAKLPTDGILFSVTDDFRMVKYSSFIDEVNSLRKQSYLLTLIYQLDKSLYVRLVRLGNDGFVKKSIVLRTYPCSERIQRELIITLEGK